MPKWCLRKLTAHYLIRFRRCNKVRQAFENRNPHVSVTARIIYYYFNSLSSFSEAARICRCLGPQYGIPTIEVLEAAKSQIQNAFNGCTVLVWAIKEGRPVIAEISADDEIKVFCASQLCRANILCTAPK